MVVELLLQNDFFYDEGTLTRDEMDSLVCRITDKECGVSCTQVPLEVANLLLSRDTKENTTTATEVYHNI